MVERKYFDINERLAKDSLAMWSFSSYVKNSATESYKKELEKIYGIVDKIEFNKPERLPDAIAIAERYSRLYAEWINKGFAIEMQCPSVMICGPANFPVRKKEKQNQARDKHRGNFDYINGLKDKLENILYGNEIVKSNDENAIEKLQSKLADLEEMQSKMKNANAYYRKNKTLHGFEELKAETIEKIENVMQQSYYGNVPFPSYELTNNNAKIKATKQRIESLKKIKQSGTREIETEFCKVVENTELMRIQLLFQDKPSKDICNLLSKNGFKWSPKNMAWQRQITENARYKAKLVLQEIQKMSA